MTYKGDRKKLIICRHETFLVWRLLQEVRLFIELYWMRNKRETGGFVQCVEVHENVIHFV